MPNRQGALDYAPNLYRMGVAHDGQGAAWPPRNPETERTRPVKTIYAPDSAAAWINAARDMAAAYPVAAFAVCVVLTAAFATWASRKI